MIGYDYTDRAMQPPTNPDEDAFIEIEEDIITLLERQGYSEIVDILVGSKSWINAIEHLIKTRKEERDLM